MSFGEWMQGHRRSVLFVLALLAAAGAFTALHLPISLFPNVAFPRVAISLDAGDRPAEQMAMLVTRPVEEAVRRVPGVLDVRSTSSRGSAEVSIDFAWGTNMAQAMLEADAEITQILPSLPAGTQMLVRRMDPTVFPIIAYSLTSSRLSLAALYDLAEYQMRPLLSAVPGVAQVQVNGGAQDEYRITIDPVRLAAHKLALSDVARVVAANNVVTAVGRLEDHYKLYLTMVDSQPSTREAIAGMVLSSDPDGVVHLGDVATVERSVQPQWIRVTADGKDAVLLNIYQQPGGNSVAIAKEVRASLAAFQPQMPKGVKFANWYDQSVLVTDSAASVRDAILMGVLLSAATLLVFLRNWKITLIAVTVVPVVLCATVVLLGALDMGFNIMTLGGMAAAVGLIIDDAIVMIENIVRRVREAGSASFHGRVLSAALEFTRPLAGSSAATLVIFIPLAFLSGVTGAFFKALSITMASALLISFFVTLLAVPILCDRWLTHRDAEQEEGGRFSTAVRLRYESLLRRLLRRPAWILLGMVPLLLAGWFAYANVGSGFMPAMDEGGFVLDYRTPPGTSLTETDRLLRQVEAIVAANPNVSTYSRRTGLGLGGDLNETNQGDFFVRLKAGNREPIETVMDEIRARIEHHVPGIDFEMAQLMEDLIGDLTAVPQPVQIKIFSDDPAVLDTSARRVAAALRGVSGIVDVRDGINPAGDALELRVDPERAAREGVDVEGVARMLNDALSGNVATQVQQGPKMVGIRVWTPAALRDDETTLGGLMLRAPDGHLFPLRRIARIVPVSGQPQIDRDNLKRMVSVTARISGRDLGSTVADVRRVLGAQNLLGKGAYFELGGLYRQQQIAFKGLMTVFAAAVALVFALLLFLYERFRIALVLLAMPLLAAGTVFIGLWATGIELNISSMMGMTMIIGIVTEVAIFYVSEHQALIREEGMAPEEALVAAGCNRLRPIAMTTLAAILALLPLALGMGQGSAMQQPLAVAIISGLLVQMPLVLLLLPVALGTLTPQPESSRLDVR